MKSNKEIYKMKKKYNKFNNNIINIWKKEIIINYY